MEDLLRGLSFLKKRGYAMLATVQRGHIMRFKEEQEWVEELIPVNEIKDNDMIPHYILKNGKYVEFYGKEIPKGETLYCVKKHIEGLKNDPDRKKRFLIAKRIYDFYINFIQTIKNTDDINDPKIQTVLGILFGWRFQVSPSHSTREWIGPNSRSEMHPRFQIGLDQLIQVAKANMQENEALMLFSNVLQNDVKSFDDAPKILIEKLLAYIAHTIIHFKRPITFFEQCMYFVLESEIQNESLEYIIENANLQNTSKEDILNALYTLEKGGFIKRNFAIKTKDDIQYLTEDENNFSRQKFKIKRRFPSPENMGKFVATYEDVNSFNIVTYWEN